MDVGTLITKPDRLWQSYTNHQFSEHIQKMKVSDSWAEEGSSHNLISQS